MAARRIIVEVEIDGLPAVDEVVARDGRLVESPAVDDIAGDIIEIVVGDMDAGCSIELDRWLAAVEDAVGDRRAVWISEIDAAAREGEAFHDNIGAT